MLSDHLNLPLRSRYTFTIIAPFLIALVVIWLAFDSSGQSAVHENIDDAEDAWEALDINDYSLVVQEIGVWEITRTRSQVSDGVVVSMHGTCDRGLVGLPCSISTLDPEQASIPGLLAYARDIAAFENRAKWLKVSIETDGGFVLSMSFNDPEILDEDWGLTAQVDFTATDDASQSEVPAPATTEEAEPSPMPAPITAPESSDIIDWIDSQELAWQELEITDYYIEFQLDGPSALQTIRMEQNEGRINVVTVWCGTETRIIAPDQCNLPTYRTIDYWLASESGLFGQARYAAAVYDGPEFAVEIHPEYHFPVIIRFDDPAEDDDQWTLTVTDFQPVPESDE